MKPAPHLLLFCLVAGPAFANGALVLRFQGDSRLALQQQLESALAKSGRVEWVPNADFEAELRRTNRPRDQVLRRFAQRRGVRVIVDGQVKGNTFDVRFVDAALQPVWDRKIKLWRGRLPAEVLERLVRAVRAAARLDPKAPAVVSNKAPAVPRPEPVLPAGGLPIPALPTAERITASRTTLPISLDGQLGEAAWAVAPSFKQFEQSYPSFGAAPTHSTELKLLYDDENLYVGISCPDEHRDLIDVRPGRRDSALDSDSVTVALDTLVDHRTAFAFTVSAGGALRDGMFYEDSAYSDEWDGRWEASTQRGPNGWTAELRIPFNTLRFSSESEQKWGIGVRREVSHNREVIDTAAIFREGKAFVSRFRTLDGLSLAKPVQKLEVTPYLAARLSSFAPGTFQGITTPTAGPSADLGLDVAHSPSSDLAFAATLNPDFGQVEADEPVLNLTTFEHLYPEKRPFFTQGLDQFQPVGSVVGEPPFRIFYSRRIGLDAPIFGAAKMSWSTEGWQLGVLDALVMGPGRSAYSTNGEVEFHPERPLHLGPNFELPVQGPLPANQFAAVMRRDVTDRVALGVTAATRTPLATRCDPAASPTSEPCADPGGLGVGADWSWRSEDAEWAFFGQMAASQATGGPVDGVRLADGTVIKSGDVGMGGYARYGRLGGEPWRFSVAYDFATPKLELNRTGYIESQNRQQLSVEVARHAPDDVLPVRELVFELKAQTGWTTDGRGISLGQGLEAGVEVVLQDFHSLEGTLGLDMGRWDVREVAPTGIAYERPSLLFAQLQGRTNPALPLSLSGHVRSDLVVGQGAVPDGVGLAAGVGIKAQALPALSFEGMAQISAEEDGARYVEDTGTGKLLFGHLHPLSFSAVVRSLWAISPRLTAQLQGQLLTAGGDYVAFYEADPLARIHQSDLTPAPAPTVDPSFRTAVLNLMATMRWELSSASTLYLIYSRALQSRYTGPPADLQQRPVWGLLVGDATDTAFVKWSYSFIL